MMERAACFEINCIEYSHAHLLVCYLCFLTGRVRAVVAETAGLGKTELSPLSPFSEEVC